MTVLQRGVLGCLMTVVGFFSMGMVAVLVARLYSWYSGCPYSADLPACHWTTFALVGGVLGAISLPTLVLRRLGKRDDVR